MFDTILFLGFPLSDADKQTLIQLPAAERELFIQNQDSSYLQKIENDGIEYLGKYLGPSIEMAALEMSYSHVYSLLKRLIPRFPYGEHSLLLLALPAQNSTS
jgi:hypothetical protein